MASNLSPPQTTSAQDDELEKNRKIYTYREHGDNKLYPIAIAAKFPGKNLPTKGYGGSWLARLATRRAVAWAVYRRNLARIKTQKLIGNFDKMTAYEQLFGAKKKLPPFAQQIDSDAAFANWRIAGANPLSLRQELDLDAARRQIDFDLRRIEPRLTKKLGRTVSLRAEARAGRLFIVDFGLIQTSLRPEGSTRDSRFRAKYLPAPTALFLEAPGFFAGVDLVPLVIQIDQPQQNNEHNPPYYAYEPYEPSGPQERWGWRMAKVYFEVADVSFHVMCGHIGRTHLPMEAFSLATPRQLPKEHAVFKLLQPHTRYTLAANSAAYDYFNSRKDTYHEFYAGTLDETRQIAIQSYTGKKFMELRLETELAERGVDQKPQRFPYRHDARLWLKPIRDFVSSYIEAFYASDAAARNDVWLQKWFQELIAKNGGALEKVVPNDLLDSREKLIDMLAQVLFTAGPGHASQHFSSNYYYRYPPAFAGSAYAPPLWANDPPNAATYRIMLPAAETAANQFQYNTFTNFPYDRFGHYGKYPLGRVPEAIEPIKKLQGDLEDVKRAILAEESRRVFPYEFLLPSRVPNSVNI